MKLQKLKIKNFRGYENLTEIEFGNLTTFVGKNDVGKSSILEALDIFFNDSKGVIKLDKDDINKKGIANGDSEIVISACFEELPDEIIIDATNKTNLRNEYLLNSSNQLEIIKKFPNAGTPKVFIKAYHPTNKTCSDLFHKKDNELRDLLNSLNINCEDKRKNSVMRIAIWNHFSSSLGLTEKEIDVTKGDTKSIWDRLQKYLPMYSLFQSDRKNSDGDSEIQDPLKEAVKQILNTEDIQQKFIEIASEVENKLKEVSNRTLMKLKEMNPEIAGSLNPQIPQPGSLKWADVFKNVSITGDDDIPINKRGSGIKRLVLLNFFRAEVELRKNNQNIPSVIYSIEEPETSQHTDHQKQLISAFINLSLTPNTQIILTSHSSVLVKELKFEHLRLISSLEKKIQVKTVLPNQLPYPSLNEVNFLAFSEISEEYHIELFGHIEFIGFFNDYKKGKRLLKYNKINKNNLHVVEEITLTEFIRHQIHHPENKLNNRFSRKDLYESIELMRDFIQNLPK